MNYDGSRLRHVGDPGALNEWAEFNEGEVEYV